MNVRVFVHRKKPPWHAHDATGRGWRTAAAWRPLQPPRSVLPTPPAQPTHPAHRTSARNARRSAQPRRTRTLKVQLMRPTFQCITHTSSAAAAGGGGGGGGGGGVGGAGERERERGRGEVVERGGFSSSCCLFGKRARTCLRGPGPCHSARTMSMTAARQPLHVSRPGFWVRKWVGKGGPGRCDQEGNPTHRRRGDVLFFVGEGGGWAAAPPRQARYSLPSLVYWWPGCALVCDARTQARARARAQLLFPSPHPRVQHNRCLFFSLPLPTRHTWLSQPAPPRRRRAGRPAREWPPTGRAGAGRGRAWRACVGRVGKRREKKK